ncbi:MAG: nucleotidyltransferase family protein, partial [Ruminococcus sp.]|nr:nucleotidyltransferase family protein [Ruminococcus sp.]
MYRKVTADFVGLLKSAIESQPYQGSNIDWTEVLRLSRFHHVDNLIFEAISMLPEDKKPAEKELFRLRKASMTQVIQDANQISEVEGLIAELEQKNIPAIMLKGWIMKDLYPRTDLRHRADT